MRNERIKVLIDPALIRQALDIAAERTRFAAARELGLHHSTVSRWQERRDLIGDPAWPTEEDVTAWRKDQADNAERRRRKRRLDKAYRMYPVTRESIGTTRRLQALHRLGYSGVVLAERLGVSNRRVSHLMTGLRDHVTKHTQAKVAALYDELSMVVPQGPRADRARRHAAKLGYAPPLAWDDELIDDPDATPAGYRKTDTRIRRTEVNEEVVQRVLDGEFRLRTSVSEKREIMRRWLATGRSERSLCLETGWKTGRYTPHAKQRAS